MSFLIMKKKAKAILKINKIQEEMEKFKGKSIDIQKKINGLLDVIGKMINLMI